MKISPKARAALDSVIDRFKSGDLAPVVRIARIQRNGDPIPSDRWSFANRVLAFVQTESLDCRGFRQWQAAGRNVQKGSRAAFIFAPVSVTTTDETTGDKITTLRGFRPVAVFPPAATAGEPLPSQDYTPADPPPLADAAARLGIAVEYLPLPPDRLGSCVPDGSRIRLGSLDPSVFFHELAHALDARLRGSLKGGQDAGQETTAEFTAAVLCELYGYPRSGNAWAYIAAYNKDPLRAIYKALANVEPILNLLYTVPVS